MMTRLRNPKFGTSGERTVVIAVSDQGEQCPGFCYQRAIRDRNLLRLTIQSGPFLPFVGSSPSRVFRSQQDLFRGTRNCGGLIELEGIEVAFGHHKA